MAGGVGHTGGLTNPAPGAEDAEPVTLILLGLPCLERRSLVKKGSLINDDNGQRIYIFLSFSPTSSPIAALILEQTLEAHFYYAI